MPIKKRGRPPKKLTPEQEELKKLQFKLKETRRQLRLYKKRDLVVQTLDGLLAKLLQETIPHWCFEYSWYNQLHEHMLALGFQEAVKAGFLSGFDPEIPKNCICTSSNCQHPYFEHFSLHGRASGRVGCLQCDCEAFKGV